MPLLRPLALLGLALPLFLHAAPHGHGHDHDPAPATASGEGQAPPALFVANRGQWPDAVRFRAALGSGAVFAGTADLTFSVVSTEDLEAAHALRHEAGNDALADFPVRGHAFRLTLVDAAPAAPEGLDRAATRFSYYLGQDPDRWASGVPGYRSVRHAGAWPGIDWHTSARGTSPKYEFAVAPGADPSLIRLRYEGLEGLRLDGDRLLLETSVGTLVEEAPYAYQRDAAGREVPVPCAFALEGGEIRFRLPEGWDASRELVIDPVLVGSSYSGMSGTSQFGFTATFGPNGDGVNDHFAPISQFALNAYRFQIYNRWGELIFDETAPGTGWDGTWKGVDQEGGVYIYVLRAAEIEGVATGTVTLVR